MASCRGTMHRAPIPVSILTDMESAPTDILVFQGRWEDKNYGLKAFSR